MKCAWILPTLLFLLVCVSACGTASQPPEENAGQTANSGQREAFAESSDSVAQPDRTVDMAIHKTAKETEPDTAMKMNVQIGGKTFAATLEDNAAVQELVEMMREAPVSIEMSDYSSFEKVGPLGRSLTTDNHQITTDAGDIVLYNGDQIVMFYGSNSWSYTKIGNIDDLTGWKDALGNGNVTAIFTVAE